MLVVIYRWRLHPELAQEFVANWHRITRLGPAAVSGGSRLFKDAGGCWVAIARWLSRAAREHFFQPMGGDETDRGMSKRAALAIIQRVGPHELESVLDCRAPFTVTTEAFAS